MQILGKLPISTKVPWTIKGRNMDKLWTKQLGSTYVTCSKAIKKNMHKACWKEPLSTHSGKRSRLSRHAHKQKRRSIMKTFEASTEHCVFGFATLLTSLCYRAKSCTWNNSRKRCNWLNLLHSHCQNPQLLVNYIYCEHEYSVQAINIWYSWHWSCWLSTTLWTKPTKLAKIFHPEWRMISHEAILSTINCKCCPLSHQLHQTRMDF